MLRRAAEVPGASFFAAPSKNLPILAEIKGCLCLETLTLSRLS